MGRARRPALLVDARLTALEGSAAETNGSRLVARYTTTTSTGADGSVQVTKSFAAWFDTQRNEYCFVQRAADGQQRCLPNESGTTGATAVTYGGVYFADSGCTKPIVFTYDSACGPAPT